MNKALKQKMAKNNMRVNPFQKDKFVCYRDWEDELVNFFVAEAKMPNLENWVALSDMLNAKDNVTYSALLLSNLLETKVGFKVSSAKLFEVYKALKNADNKDNNHQNFESWLHTGWLSLPRVAGMVNAQLAQSEGWAV